MRILLLADIHIGNIKDTVYVYNTITDIIEKEVVFKKTDAVIILGDYFDHLFKVNEEYVSIAINVMSYLIRACERCKTKIRIVYGTESHEMNQYKLFNYHFSSALVDIKLFTTCTHEELFKGVNVLYIPEEYVLDKHDFYKKFLYKNKKYDFIFGHGTIVDGMPERASYGNNNSNVKEAKVPIFKSGELSEISNLTVFGHYHKYTKICDNVYYLGSLFRHEFGEEEAKGYAIIEDGKFNFIENTNAYVFKTYEFDEKSDVYNSPDKIVELIDKVKEENPEVFGGSNNGKIRLKFKLPNDIDPSFKENLRSILVKDKLIYPMISESDKTLLEEIGEDLEDELDFIIQDLKPTDKIYRFINKFNGNVMTFSELDRYINKPLVL